MCVTIETSIVGAPAAASGGPLRVADFFAGIGGIRLGFCDGFDTAVDENSNIREIWTEVDVVYGIEYDKNAVEVYTDNFWEDPTGDVTMLDIKNDVPPFDILLAGFPCQAFSIAGEKRGFDDTRGTLFYYLAEVLGHVRPLAFIFENVPHLERHRGGRTFAVIIETLESAGYHVYWKILNARDFGLAQNRPRIFIVGFRWDVGVTAGRPFEFSNHVPVTARLSDILETRPPLDCYISQQYYESLVAHRKRHEAKGHGFGYKVLNPEGVCHTLVVGGMGRERNLVADEKNYPGGPDTVYDAEIHGDKKLKTKNTEYLRTMTPRECARAQGFPDTFRIHPRKTHAFKQMANTVPVPVVSYISVNVMRHLYLSATVNEPKYHYKPKAGLLWDSVKKGQTRKNKTPDIDVCVEV